SRFAEATSWTHLSAWGSPSCGTTDGGCPWPARDPTDGRLLAVPRRHEADLPRARRTVDALRVHLERSDDALIDVAQAVDRRATVKNGGFIARAAPGGSERRSRALLDRERVVAGRHGTGAHDARDEVRTRHVDVDRPLRRVLGVDADEDGRRVGRQLS